MIDKATQANRLDKIASESGVVMVSAAHLLALLERSHKFATSPLDKIGGDQQARLGFEIDNVLLSIRG